MLSAGWNKINSPFEGGQGDVKVEGLMFIEVDK
jgi:hypothetical protein